MVVEIVVEVEVVADADYIHPVVAEIQKDHLRRSAFLAEVQME